MHSRSKKQRNLCGKKSEGKRTFRRGDHIIRLSSLLKCKQLIGICLLIDEEIRMYMYGGIDIKDGCCKANELILIEPLT